MILIFAESHNGITGRVVNITILRGRDGRNGRDGRDGLRGPSGMCGPTGDKGDKGDKGDRGDQGQPGTVKGGKVVSFTQGLEGNHVEVELSFFMKELLLVLIILREVVEPIIFVYQRFLST